MLNLPKPSCGNAISASAVCRERNDDDPDTRPAFVDKRKQAIDDHKKLENEAAKVPS